MSVYFKSLPIRGSVGKYPNFLLFLKNLSIFFKIFFSISKYSSPMSIHLCSLRRSCFVPSANHDVDLLLRYRFTAYGEQIRIITNARLYNFDPLISHFYIVKLGFTGYALFFLFCLKHRLWALVRTASARRF